jgi:polar amino acid transport system substrate-binding protein
MHAIRPLWACFLGLVSLVAFNTQVLAEDLEAKITEKQVVDLVGATCAALGKDAPATLASINKGEAPYKDAANPTLYVFVYDLDVKMIAHPKADLVGKSMKGKPDLKGKRFRDEIVEKAKAETKGWVDYLYQKPGETGIFEKTTYFQMAKGSDGASYVVCCGKYRDKK